MTRQGSLAYYLAAWVCGCVFTSTGVFLRTLWGPNFDPVSLAGVYGLLWTNFLGLILGAFAALLFAVVLARLARFADLRKVWQWAVAGAILGPMLSFILGLPSSRYIQVYKAPSPEWLQFLSSGPAVVILAGWWLAIPAGAATAWVLFRVQRAFALPIDRARET